MSLLQYLSADYVRAANQLKGGRKRIIAFVEGYDDIAFWSPILRRCETPSRYFEVMLPSRNSLAKGKKMALSNKLGPEMIACVDADYDWMLNRMPSSYVLHTYVYAIENFQCHADGLHEVCVKATLNDATVFSFVEFLRDYSKTIWPLFLWSVWAYSSGNYKRFPLSDLAHAVTAERINYHAANRFLSKVQRNVEQTLSELQKEFPHAAPELQAIRVELQSKGIEPSTTYLYMRGHDLMDGVVLPILDSVCCHLRNLREGEINTFALHNRQKQNELSAYHNACAPVANVLRKHETYASSPLYQRIITDAERLLTIP